MTRWSPNNPLAAEPVSEETLSPGECLYHWSPRARRKGIERLGLVPGKRARGGLDWRPQYICFADNPILGWDLSGKFADEPGVWDLWATYTTRIPELEVITDHYGDTGRCYVKEVRVYARVFKRDLIWVGERVSVRW